MATPEAQEAYEQFFSTLGGKPVHATLATHWARLVEMLSAAETMCDLAGDPGLIGPDIRNVPTAVPTECVGVVEAPRGTLFHHCQTDERGLITAANLIVATQNNAARIAMSVDRAACHWWRESTTINNNSKEKFAATEQNSLTTTTSYSSASRPRTSFISAKSARRLCKPPSPSLFAKYLRPWSCRARSVDRRKPDRCLLRVAKIHPCLSHCNGPERLATNTQRLQTSETTRNV